ncbi:hypothetical protein GQ43DRAFT_482295 [Delitschia confertaspora ATCC 74209]|uniref:Dipeptidyl-peptidase V n=1 Tax=Delitschia confertaspora ATCC 74209 TaxID=1513339 RepID=A0A9P4JI58_9PLEO|nr:hypothetical protein GQ43DRAFT_482295 [Delitschia confertaspora ATCC 74209]
MTVRAVKFTPEVLLSAPRRSAGIPNSDGSKILYSISTYSFAEHSKKTEIRFLDVETQETTLVTNDDSASEPTWLGDDHILLLFSGSGGTTTVKIGKTGSGFKESSYTAGEIPAPASNVKVHDLGDGNWAFAVTAQATPDGDFYNPEKEEKPQSSGKLYKSMFVRHWDSYVTENRNSIWIGSLYTNNGQYKLPSLKNALKGTGLESPIPPFGGSDHFDIGNHGLIFTAKDPDLNPATHTKTNIYLITSGSSWANFLDDLPKPKKVELYGCEGASTGPVFSPDGKKAAFLSMRRDGYEADKNQLFIIPDIRNSSWVIHALASEDGKGRWDRSPQAVVWSHNGESPLYFVAEDHGRTCLFSFEFSAGGGLTMPEMIVRGGAISDVRTLETGDLFISSSSLIDSSVYSLYSTLNKQQQLISSLSKEGLRFGLSHKQVSEVYWNGATKGTKVHAWVVKPSTFNENENYPLAYLIHGGPQGAWQDSWSTRWNPAVFAEQGYVVICPNPTGSTSYGQDFTDAIQGQWGGLPYEDLVNGFEWIEKNLDFVDTKRAVALGASYGGFMMNWIQGHPLGRKFKALVTHDGVFNMSAQMASEELYFPFHDLRGRPWENRPLWDKWDPSRFTENWETPHLIIHSELDYRLTISEGLAAFHTLQARGVESQFLMFTDENHWVLKPENSLMWHEVVLDWINGHVGLPKYTEGKEEEKKKEVKEKLPVRAN